MILKSLPPINEWKSFLYDEIFEIHKGKRLTKSDMIEGSTPYIGASDKNNGVTAYIGQNPIFSKDKITVAYNGSVCEAFWHDSPFWASDDLNVLEARFPLNKYIAHFLTTVIRLEKPKFSFGRKWHRERMEKSIIKLPVDDNGKPNWDLIEDCMKTLSNEMGINIASMKKPASDTSVSLPPTSEWKFFPLMKLFSISLGAPLHKNHIEELSSTKTEKFKYSYVTRSGINNGVNGYVAELDDYIFQDGNCITIGAEGCVAFYQESAFATGNKVNILRSNHCTKESYLFICTVLNTMMKAKFHYGRAAVKGRLEETGIKLPIDANGHPDWQLMEDYIKSLPYSASI